MKLRLHKMLPIAVLLVPTLACGCTTIAAIADGRISAATSVTSSNDITFSFDAKPGHSYSAEVMYVQQDLSGSSDLQINVNTSACQTTDTTDPSVTDTTSVDPSFAGGRRVSIFPFATLATHLTLYVNIHNTNTFIGHLVTFSAVDTTLFSPAWITNGSYDTFYSFLNTTGSSVNGTLILVASSGGRPTVFSFTLPPGGVAFTNTATLGVTRGQVGTAVLANLGPPGAILATASINNFTSSPAYNQPVAFKAVRGAH